MRIWTRKSALIQSRTSLGKSDGVVAEGEPPRGLREADLAAEAVDREVRGREREQQSDPHAARRRGALQEPELLLGGMEANLHDSILVRKRLKIFKPPETFP